MFIDTHCHLFKEYYDSLDYIIKSSKENNVGIYINNGTNMDSNKEVIESLKYNEIYGAIGIHPEEVDKYKKEDLDFIEENLSSKKIVAIGEIGLDYYYTKDNKNEQIKLFEYQVKLAEKYNMPVIVHSREATEDTINILKKYNVKGTIHSFTGSLETAKIYIKMGYMLGINGVVTFKNCKIIDVIKKIGLGNIILETDSPYLTPVPYRGKQNNPSHIIDIAKYLAEELNISLEDVLNVTTNNAIKIYKGIDIE